MKSTSSDERSVRIVDDGDLRKYRTEIPNVVFELGLTPYEFTLYSHLKRVAGTSGACWKKTSTLAEETRMSAGAVSNAKTELAKPRRELRGKALIVITEETRAGGGKPNHIITITDIWPENFACFSGANSHHESAISPHEIAISPGEIKKKPLKQERTSRRTHTHRAPAREASAPPAAGVGVLSKFSLKQCLEWAEASARQPGAQIKKARALGMARYRDSLADDLIAEYLNPSPGKTAAARESPASGMTYAEAGQIVNSLVDTGHDAAQAIDGLSVSDEIKQRLRQHFLKAGSKSNPGHGGPAYLTSTVSARAANTP